MVVTELHLVQVQGESVRAHPVVFEELSLGIAPEALEAVDVHSPAAEPSGVIDSQVAIAVEGERIVGVEFVGVHEGAPLDQLHGFVHERVSGDIWNHRNQDLALPLQDAEHRNLPRGSATTPTLPSPAKVGLIGFHFLSEQLGLLFSKYRSTDRRERPQHSRITNPRSRGRLKSAHFQLEQLEEPQPGDGCHARFGKPGAGEISERVTTPTAAISSFLKAIDDSERTLEASLRSSTQRLRRSARQAERSFRISFSNS